ncbi:conjugative transfer relaxase/helicase TraI domain-containing protein, partial [Escherichia coli]|uniref:conjugative transfer relaxase/helicase TraI domain-containing protein n=1 Tax=Escherichia coli TaxID=562 RepID=UPI00237ADB57
KRVFLVILFTSFSGSLVSRIPGAVQDAINNAVQKGTAHDVLEPKSDREVMNAERLFSTARELRDVVAGRAVLRQAGLAGGDSPARFIAPGRKYPQPYVALPAFDRNGKSAGIWLNPLTTDDGNGLRGFSGEGRVKGSGDAQFVARHCCKVSDEAAFCLIQRPYISKTLLT